MTAFNYIIGQSAELQNVIRSAQIVAATDVTVLVEGDTGTGKELLARALHESSQRANQAFITINCAALPEALVESELFGHRKGAFTGATCDQAGYIDEAEGGTLFLDEIGELPLAVQAKLLRFIENGECQSLGDSHPRRVNVRLIAATNRNLQQQVEQGGFRADLYYRLKIVPLELPPLQQRGKDIGLLINHFLSYLSEQHKMPMPVMSRSALSRLQNYSWPGNVRELRNLCERLVVLLPGKLIEETNLPMLSEPNSDETASDARAFKLPRQGLCLESLETDLIRQALGQTGGNKSHAARLLGISRDAFLYRLKKYSI